MTKETKKTSKKREATPTPYYEIECDKHKQKFMSQTKGAKCPICVAEKEMKIIEQKMKGTVECYTAEISRRLTECLGNIGKVEKEIRSRSEEQVKQIMIDVFRKMVMEKKDEIPDDMR